MLEVGEAVKEVVATTIVFLVELCVVLVINDAVVLVVCATVVCIKQRFSTTTGSTGQQGAPRHCMVISADNFVQMPVPGAPFTMSYLEIFKLY